jgi:SAM-dependent methyltransferase
MWRKNHPLEFASNFPQFVLKPGAKSLQMQNPRANATKNIRELAIQYLEAGKSTEWFEVLYAQAKSGQVVIPWANLEPNPNLTEWLHRQAIQGSGQKALVVGCGLGDDVEELARSRSVSGGESGFQATGFDIAASAIEGCQTRFPQSRANYVVADLLNPPSEWQQAFDFVLESYTLQSLPAPLRPPAITQIANFVAPGGTLLLICRARDAEEPPGQLPWPLTQAELLQFVTEGLTLQNLEDYWDQESPPVRRFRAEFSRTMA